MECSHLKFTKFSKSDSVALYRCNICDLVFNDNYHKDFNAADLYADYYKKEVGGRFSFGIEYVVRMFRFFRAFKIFTTYPAAKSILDIGSGRGFMLYYLRKYFKFNNTIGIQISKNSVEFSRKKLGLLIYDKDFLDIDFRNMKFDIINMTHVLEHVARPEAYIEKISRLINKNGRLIIEVPNFNSWTRRLTGKYWLGLDLDYHITYFTPESLCSLLKKYKFRVRTVRTFSLEYSAFISAQSLTSLITKAEDVIFQYIQKSAFNLILIPQLFFFFLLFPGCLLINLILYFSKIGEVLFVAADMD